MSSDDHANGSGAGQGAWAVYRRLLGHAWLYWPFLLAAMAAMIVEAAAGAAFVWLMEPLTNDGFVDPKPEMAVVLPAAIIGLFALAWPRSPPTTGSPGSAAAWCGPARTGAGQVHCACQHRFDRRRSRRW